MIAVLGAGRIKLDYGPMQMTIAASRDQYPLAGAVQEAARYAMAVLDDLARYKDVARRPQAEIIIKREHPEILRQMIAAVVRSGDATLTPMAAVAGAIADLVADFLLAAGATKVVVNNGGDIALRLQKEERLTVGVVPVIGAGYSHRLQIKAGEGIGGIATSGLGGRSFTKGIATAVTVTAATAAAADACATSTANAVYTPHPGIKLDFAKNIDPDSDIGDHLVVCGVDDLPPDVIRAALANGCEQAQKYYERKLIGGAALFFYHWARLIPEAFILPAGVNE